MALAEKQRKVLVEAIKNPKNSKKNLSEFFFFDKNSSSTPSEPEEPAKHVSKPSTGLRYSNKYKEAVLQRALAIHPDLKAHSGDVKELKALLDLDGKAVYKKGGIDLTGDILHDARELLAALYNIEPDDDAGYERLGLRENKMEKFNYREYVQDNWLLQEAKGPATTADLKGFATKDATLSREKRAQKGNWKGSVGKYVEDHRAEIDAAAKQGHRALRAYIRAKMIPALGPEEQKYLEGFLTGYATDQQLHMALYNVLLKGHGLGLHEEQEGISEGRVWDVIVDRVANLIGNPDYAEDVADEMGEASEDDIMRWLDMSFEAVARDVKSRLGLELHEEENIPADITKKHISTDDKLNLAAGGKTLQQAVKILQKQFNYPITTGKVFGGTVIDLSQVPPEKRDEIIQWTGDNLGGYGYTY